MRIKVSHNRKKYERMPLRQLQIHHVIHSPLALHRINLNVELYLPFCESMLLFLPVQIGFEGIVSLRLLWHHFAVMALLEGGATLVMVVAGEYALD
jgi:hypothetical protein